MVSFLGDMGFGDDTNDFRRCFFRVYSWWFVLYRCLQWNGSFSKKEIPKDNGKGEFTPRKSKKRFMIIGLGNDMIDIRRIEKILIRHGSRFIQRIFTDIEQNKSENFPKRSYAYAKRFAAKEACAKALGTGIAYGVNWRDIGIVNSPSGKPTIKLTNHAQIQLEKLLPSNHDASIHLSMTDDFPWAQAFVIIEALPRG